MSGRWIAGGLAAAAVLAMPGTASACRFLATRPNIDGAFKAIIVAEVDVARDTGQTSAWIWEIVAHVTRVVEGDPDLESYSFRYFSGTNGCDPSPPRGAFVLYVQDTPEGERVIEARPLAEMERLDPRLQPAATGPLTR